MTPIRLSCSIDSRSPQPCCDFSTVPVLFVFPFEIEVRHPVPRNHAGGIGLLPPKQRIMETTQTCIFQMAWNIDVRVSVTHSVIACNHNQGIVEVI